MRPKKYLKIFEKKVLTNAATCDIITKLSQERGTQKAPAETAKHLENRIVQTTHNLCKRTKRNVI